MPNRCVGPARRLLLVPTLAVLTACVVHVHTHMLDASVPRAEICPEAVRVFQATADVGAAFVELAELSVADRFYDWRPSEEQILAAQRKKAANLGANGLIVRHLEATAIYIPSDSAGAAATCRPHGA